ncbi:hypothetical protein NGF19_14670 [Streptomyces sp. RY43-2]|uniref:Transmembrane protein n=1 Tax=Streptomyces macrolidinus TaxID=2952607 RepID=A0ABT0ZEL0_9ACTN|nr:hypothetical protein [Streptomyces macrolidinus]MCN9242018.1 hypothetical protein [Streptomyces macrolidinus]
MHMNSVPQHLLSEDRQDYERILDEALRSAAHRPEPTVAGQRLTFDQLRTMALDATALITAAAATEYQHYVEVREELRRPAPSAPSVKESAADSSEPAPAPSPNSASEPDGPGLAASVGEAAASAGAGAVVTVLAPVLAGAAAAIFLLVGYLLKMVYPDEAFVRTLLTTGWVFGAVTAAAMLVAATGLLLTALRHGSATEEAAAREALAAEVARAREAWHEALRERGILPFLRRALVVPDTTVTSRKEPEPTSSRMPHLGYDRPGFSSPENGPASGPRPRFSSPDFTSPDFGGPEHRPE